MSADKDVLRVFERAQRRKGLRPRTILDRSRLLTRLQRDGPLLRWSTDGLEDWLDQQNVSLRSRKAYLSHLHAFYSWAVISGRRVDDPTTPIVAPKVPRMLPRPMDDDDLTVALEMAPARMKAWLSLACYEGFRCMEIAQLAREDILDRADPPMLRVVDGKGGKEGLVPLHPAVLDALHEYGLPQSGPVFLSTRGRPFAPATVSGYVSDYLHGLGIEATAHMGRHWFGTNVYADTRDLRMTQELMRHSDPSSTAGYVAYNQPGAAAAVAGLSPRARQRLPLGEHT